MSKVISFSPKFPAYHPRKGEATFFVEKIWKSLGYDIESDALVNLIRELNPGQEHLIQPLFESLNYGKFEPKHHTMRAGHRFKVGDKFSPRIWGSGGRYVKGSKQIAIAPDIEVVKTWDFDIDMLGGEYRLNGFEIPIEKLRLIAINDGFTTLDDFELWFNVKRGEGFLGQIICWSPNIDY